MLTYPLFQNYGINLPLHFLWHLFVASLRQHYQHIRDRNTKFKNKELHLGETVPLSGRVFSLLISPSPLPRTPWIFTLTWHFHHRVRQTTINPGLSLRVVTQICLNWYFLMTFLFPRQQIYISICAVGNIQYSIDLASELPYLMQRTLQSRMYRLFFVLSVARPSTGLHSHWNPLLINRKV